ncbi:hypothetical protein [Brucella anthropi]|uniref:hypothetical protein n=1 Tax=Brucella anthropi TaxID=529 RepID=UPI0012DA6F44|nr:hypothetical protein [Brucella anthropi]
MSGDLRKRVERGRHGARSGAHGRIRQFQATVCGPKLSGQGRVEPVLEQSGCCPQCHIPEMQTGYIHMRIGNSLGIVTTDVLAQTQVKAEGRVQPGLFRFWDVFEGREATAQGTGSVQADKPISKKSSNTDGRRVSAGFDSRNGFRC